MHIFSIMPGSDFPYNQYSVTANMYDFDNRAKLVDDIKFYVDYCVAAQGPILELCCGTGRITIPVAQAGCNITGLDISVAMLDVFKGKLGSTPAEVQNRVELVQGNMASFNLGKQFTCVIIPFTSFPNLTDDSDIAGCLNCVYRHLQPNGTFIVHMFKPYKQLDETWQETTENDNIVLRNDDGSIKFKRSSINRLIDVERQVIYSDLFYYTYNNGELVDKRTEYLKLKYYYPDQLKALLQKHGFEVQEQFGYYDKRPFDVKTSGEMIFVARKV